MMKKLVHTLAAGAMLALTAGSAQAAVYKTIASGDFSDPAVWQGGLVPPSPSVGDDIEISTGHVIDLDLHLGLANTRMVVRGILIQKGTRFISFSTSTGVPAVFQVIDGQITVDSMYFSSRNGMLEVNGGGVINTGAFHCNYLVAQQSGSVHISRALYVQDDLNTPYTNFGMGANSKIIISGGTINTNGNHVLKLNDPYEVHYITNSAATMGYELEGQGLGTVVVNPGSGNTVSFTGDTLRLNCPLQLASGEFDFSDVMVYMGPNTTIPAGAGKFKSSPTSGLDVKSTAPGVAWGFASQSAIGFIRLQTGGAALTLGTNIEVVDSLVLVSGKLHTNGQTLTIAPSASVMVLNPPAYIVPDNNGTVKYTVQAGDSMLLPIGTATDLTPAQTRNNGSTPVTAAIGTTGKVLAGGDKGTDLSAITSCVKNTWNITLPSGANINMRLAWQQGAEANSFDRTQSYASKNENGKWQTAAPTAALPLNLNGTFFVQSINNLTASAMLAVLDKNTNLSVNDVAHTAKLAIYPNPATSAIQVAVKAEAQATIYNTVGQALQQATVNNNNNTINIATLPAGTYYLQLQGADGATGTGSFVKQ